MHRALSIPEVLHQVMQNLCPQPISYSKQKKTRTTLLNAALTCSSFSGPALDVLWHTMDDLIPLFKLLPNFELSRRESNIWGIITENHVSTFNTYAARIKRYASRTENSIHISAYLRILQAAGRSYLLPNLTYFDVMKPTNGEVLFLMSPRLQELSFLQGNPAIFLDSLASLAPNLVTLTLSDVVLDNHCLSAFGLLTGLEKLVFRDVSSRIKHLTLDFLLDMSAQHTLRYLVFEGSMFVVPSQSSMERDPVIFSVLKEICIDVHIDMEAIAAFTYCTRFPLLEELTIGFRDLLLEPDRSSIYWRQFFDNISRATTEHFKTLTIDGPIPRATMELHFYDLPKLPLTSFTIRHHNSNVNHCVVGSLIDAWPQLTKLSLPKCDPHPEMDFQALITIALGLPQLDELTLSINGAVLPDLESIPLLFHGLHNLSLRMSPKPHAKFIVKAVDRLFPKLQQHSLWEEANSLLELLHCIRRDDATRLTLGMSETSPVLQKGI